MMNTEIFFNAIMHCHVETVKQLLKDYPSLLKCKTKNGHTPLMLSMIFYSRRGEMVKFLLSCDVDVNEKDSNGNTILNLVPEHKIGEFIGYGCKIDIKNNKGLTVLEHFLYDRKRDHIRAVSRYYYYIEGRELNKENINFEKIAQIIGRKGIDYEIDLQTFKNMYETSTKPILIPLSRNSRSTMRYSSRI